jgi:type I restriction enzyme M protein
MSTQSNSSNISKIIWDSAETLRGNFKQSQYGQFILPLTLMFRLNSLHSENWDKAREYYNENKEKLEKDTSGVEADLFSRFLKNTSNKPLGFYNYYGTPLTKIDFSKELRTWISSFSNNVKSILEGLQIWDIISKLEEKGLLKAMFVQFGKIDFNDITDHQMGYVLEDIIRRWSESANDEAGQHFTPEEVVHLLTDLLLFEQDPWLEDGISDSIYDPTSGTGGILSYMHKVILDRYPNSDISLFGQELEANAANICKANMMLQGKDPENIEIGNTLTNDKHQNGFRYIGANPPFGVKWRTEQPIIQQEVSSSTNRFKFGLPSVEDGSFLFVQHMISKMIDDEQGTRIAVVLAGSPLFKGDAGSGESEIRRHILENDLLEGVIALPKDLFYNTAIPTYIWVLSNRKKADLKNKVILINAIDVFEKMSKSLGSKRAKISENNITYIMQLYKDASNCVESSISKTVPIDDFFYQKFKLDRYARVKFRIDLQVLEDLARSKDWKYFTNAERALIQKIVDEKNGTIFDRGKPFKECFEGLATDKFLTLANFAWFSHPEGILSKSFIDTDDCEEEIITGRRPVIDWITEQATEDATIVIPEKVSSKLGTEISFTKIFFNWDIPQSSNDLKAKIKNLSSDLFNLCQTI